MLEYLGVDKMIKKGRKPIEVIAWFDMEGNPAPLKFRYLDEREEAAVVKIDKVIRRDTDNFAGNRMIKYFCESTTAARGCPFEIRYELDTCRWFLYNI